jgi:hypothetical protein
MICGLRVGLSMDGTFLAEGPFWELRIRLVG